MGGVMTVAVRDGGGVMTVRDGGRGDDSIEGGGDGAAAVAVRGEGGWNRGGSGIPCFVGICIQLTCVQVPHVALCIPARTCITVPPFGCTLRVLSPPLTSLNVCILPIISLGQYQCLEVNLCVCVCVCVCVHVYVWAICV